MRDECESDHRRSGRALLEIEPDQRQHRFHVARRCGKIDRTRVVAVGFEREGQLDPFAREALHLHSF